MLKKSIFWLLMLSFTLTLMESNTVITYLEYGLTLFLYSIFPTLFPILLITDLIIKYNLANFLIPWLSKITKLLYKVEGYPALIIFLSLLTGTPGNAKLISNAYLDKHISKDTVNKLLWVTHSFNPMFLIATVGVIYFNNITFGITLLCTGILTNIVIARFIKIDHKPTYLNQINNIHHSFNDIILSNFKTLILVAGIVIIATIFLGFITLLPFNLTTFIGLIEVTTGSKIISVSSLPNLYQYLLTVIFFSFGSFSIIAQNISIMGKIIDKKSYIQIRIIASMISLIIFLIFYLLII